MDIFHSDDMIFRGHTKPAPDDIGTPLEDAMYAPGPQERVDSCAIRSQQHVLSMYGIDVSESELVQDAIAHHEYSMNEATGTSLDDVGNLLERNGVETNRYEGATMAHLISELGQGHKIIVGVDAYEIIADSPEERFYEMQKDTVAQIPNHTLVVVNVDPNTFEVDIVDPADGQIHRISADKFVDAWEDSNCFMVSTAKSPEEYITDITETPGHISESKTYEGGIVMNNTGMHSIDTNGDGIADIVEQDTNGDGRMEHLSVDTDHDGFSDVTIESNPGLVSTSVTPNLGSQGHVSGVSATGNEVSLGHVSGVSATGNEAGLGISGHDGDAVSTI